ncbi:hypothetical protein FRC09_016333 [Ceratobasidium sp. 395]|nr:hypothetical protein FRC09_016333 [Ceratobasidium sp. 395]
MAANILQDYQGIMFAGWDALDQDFRIKSHLHISPQRLPPEQTRLDDPHDWLPQEVETVAKWLRKGQQILDEGREAEYGLVFCYIADGQDTLQLVASPDSILCYDYNSAMYYAAMTRFNYQEDAYLPRGKPPSLIPDDLKAAFEGNLVSYLLAGHRLYYEIERYEQMSPSQRQAQETNPMLFTHCACNANTIHDVVAQKHLPEAALYWLHPQYPLWSTSALMYWATETDALIDPVTKLVYGGYGSVFCLLLIALIEEFFQRTDHRSFADDEQNQLIVLLNWATSTLHKSMEDSARRVNQLTANGHWQSWWLARNIHYASATPGHFAEIDCEQTQPQATGVCYPPTKSPVGPLPKQEGMLDLSSPLHEQEQKSSQSGQHQQSLARSVSPHTTIHSQPASPLEQPKEARVPVVTVVEPADSSTQRSSSELPAGRARRRDEMELDLPHPPSNPGTPELGTTMAPNFMDSDITNLMGGQWMRPPQSRVVTLLPKLI